MNTTVYRCPTCDRMFPAKNLIGSQCLVCGGTMNDVTGTKVANEFLAIVNGPVPSKVKYQFMDRRMPTDYGNGQS